jgi:flagellar biosynthesis protein FliP
VNELGLPQGALAWWLVAALPLALAGCTAFAKISIVLAAVRIGLGAELLLPYVVILALALALTGVAMAPTATSCWSAVESAGGIDGVIRGGPEAWMLALDPLRAFLSLHADPAEKALFAGLGGRSEEHVLAVIPAFLVTEISEALSIVVYVLIPFIVIDLAAAQVVSIMSLQGVPLPLLTLPAKLLLFLAVGGWDRIVIGLLEGYA